jgi:hypothetical protein
MLREEDWVNLKSETKINYPSEIYVLNNKNCIKGDACVSQLLEIAGLEGGSPMNVVVENSGA